MINLPLRAAAIAATLALIAPATWADDAATSTTAQTAAPAKTTKAPEEAAAPAEKPVIHEMTLGAEDAPVTVMEYASFTCPHCAAFHDDQFLKLKADYIDTGKVRFIYRDVYFDRIGLWAAMLARCEPERFFGIADLIYSKQNDWLNSNDPVKLAANLRKLGKIAGLPEDQMKACMEDGAKAKALVNWYQANVEKDKIEGTPTLIIDGEKHSNMSWAELKKIIDAKLGS
jgi:protein-disulfide isomerase